MIDNNLFREISTNLDLNGPNLSFTTQPVGVTTVNNGDWNITENSFFITATSKPNMIIDSYSFSSIGFEIFRKPNIPNQTWQPITITILNSSGSDSIEDNNTYNLIIKTQ
jgi:hypothetical protein